MKDDADINIADGDQGLTQLVKSWWKPFEHEFESDEIELRRQNEEVMQEICLASRHAASRAQNMQVVERQDASRHRKLVELLYGRVEKGLEEDRLRRSSKNLIQACIRQGLIKRVYRCTEAALSGPIINVRQPSSPEAYSKETFWHYQRMVMGDSKILRVDSGYTPFRVLAVWHWQVSIQFLLLVDCN